MLTELLKQYGSDLVPAWLIMSQLEAIVKHDVTFGELIDMALSENRMDRDINIVFSTNDGE